MPYSTSRLFLALSTVGLLAACVPTTTTSTSSTPIPVVAQASVPKEGVYLATSDNGFQIPAVDPAKVPGEFQRQVVDYPTTEAPGTVIINPASKHLYFVSGNGKAIRYGIAVGKAGFQWSGEAKVTNRRPWPTWTPPKEMIERKPELSKWESGQPGGPTNPLGARALYLTTNGVDYGYRIHGTPDWWSIGKNASSGCIRMINQDVMDLYSRVPDGAKVVVLTADGKMPKGLNLPPPAPKKKAPVAPKPAVAAATEAALPTTPAAVTSPVGGGMSEAPVAPDDASGAAPLTPVAAPSVPTVPPSGVATPASPVVAAPVMSTAPAATTPPAAAPLVPPTAPACAVPLVNGLCPN
ncbi:MAG: L,D-transpeptidase [Paracoccaceae bacterium]